MGKSNNSNQNKPKSESQSSVQNGKKKGKKGKKSKKQVVMTKEQKNRQKREAKAKAKEKDLKEFQDMLIPHGLCVKTMIGDGNCCFRSIADQINADQTLYPEYREEAFQYVLTHQNQFTMYAVGERTMDNILRDLKEDGVWGGEEEIVALGRKFKFNYAIFHNGRVQLEDEIFQPKENRPFYQVSYHRAIHYNSVRWLDTQNNDVPWTITHETLEEIKDKVQQNNAPDTTGITEFQKQIKFACNALGVENASIMREILQDKSDQEGGLTYEKLREDLIEILQIYLEVEAYKVAEEIKYEEEKKDYLWPYILEDLEISSDLVLLGDDQTVVEVINLNDPCRCNSNNQYKSCCYQIDQQRTSNHVQNQRANRLNQQTNANGSVIPT